MTLPFHPLADLFPLIEGKDFDDLVASIKAGGQHNPIVMLNGEILDGRNRYRACLAAGVAPRFEDFGAGDPVRFVMDHNIHRRHLNESQRGMIAAKLATMKMGDNQHQKEGVEISTPSIPPHRPRKC
ncbi:MAG: ParB N-terminal domain-containing protein [Pseudolabrys sp.]